MRLKGSGGGGAPKQSQPRAAVEAPNTLQSKNTARVVDLLCEGPVKGLVNGLQSVYLDDTALENSDGTFNFEGVTVETRQGDPDQTALNGYPQIENEVSVGVKVLQASPVVRTITEADTDAARVKMRVTSLVAQSSNGDLQPTKVEFWFEIQPDGGSYSKASIHNKWVTFVGSQTGTDVTGLRVTVNDTVTGISGSTQSKTLTVQYREVGSVTWLDLGSRLVQAAIPLSNQQTGSETISSTFEVTCLIAGQYEYQVTAGNLVQASQATPEALAIEGKTTSAYEASYRLDLPADGAPWNIRVTRITDDSESALLNNDLYFSTYTKVIDAKLSYPDTALNGISVDAELFGPETPARSYDGEWKIIQLPSNYDPDARTYTGIWDGTFQVAYSNNPAWVLYDLLTNARYGLGRDIDADQIDKFALYDIGVYCDELVDDGFGGQEPRFTINCVLNTQREAYDVINSITSAFRGMSYWASGTVTAVNDAPSDPVKLVTPANVIDGTFNYSGTALKSRHSVAMVTWNDPKDGYKPAIAVVEDPAMIALYGNRQIDTVAFGCTSHGQAIRFGKWILDTEKNETETVTYNAGLDHADVRPGDVIAVADPDFADVRMGGRIVTPDLTRLVIDNPVTLNSNETYIVSVVLPDGSIENRELTNTAGETSTLTWASALTDTPVKGGMWILDGSTISPRLFRVISVRENDKHIFEVTALFHDPTKYARVESDIVLNDGLYTSFQSGTLKAPTALSAQQYLYQAGPSVKSAITLSWTAATDSRVGFYEIEAIEPNSTAWQFVKTVAGVSFDLLDTISGDYSFRVRAVDQLGGLKSQWVTFNQEFNSLFTPPADVENFNIQVIDGNAYLSWDPVPDLDLSYYIVKHSTAVSGATWGSASILFPRVSRDSTGVSLQARSGTYLIKAVDTEGVESANPIIIVSTIAAVQGLNVVDTVTENPTFDGTKTDVSVVSSALQFSNASITEGTYLFDNGFDLGAVYTSRITPTIVASGADLLNYVDDWPNIDLVEDWDGADPSKWSVELQQRTTLGDPALSPTWSEWATVVVGDYTARAFEWRLILKSFESRISPVVTTATIQIDMPDRVSDGFDNLSSTSGTTITFTPAFKTRPSIGITSRDMGTGEYYEITNESDSGFDIQFFNMMGTGVARTFDYLAKGYGYEI